MPLTCPNCKTDLPEQGDLEYRFCPRCGAEISAADTEIADNSQTIPPDLNSAATHRRERAPESETIKMRPAPVPDQTLEPVIPATSKPRPKLKPPPGPPPASFFREGPPHPSSASENPQEAQIQKYRRSLKFLIIVIGVITILMGGILYLLLG